MQTTGAYEAKTNPGELLIDALKPSEVVLKQLADRK